MFKISDANSRTIGVVTPEDVYSEVKRITNNLYCAAAARNWAAKADKNKAYSLLDFLDEQLSASKFGTVDASNVPYFRIVFI